QRTPWITNTTPRTTTCADTYDPAEIRIHRQLAEVVNEYVVAVTVPVRPLDDKTNVVSHVLGERRRKSFHGIVDQFSERRRFCHGRIPNKKGSVASLPRR